MKRLFLGLLLSVIVQTITAQSNYRDFSEEHTPHPFFKEGKEWLIRTHPFGSDYAWQSSPFCYTITVCGDSVVDGITYKKLYYNRKILMGLFIEENSTPCVYTGNDVYCVQNQGYRPYCDGICYRSDRPCISCPRHLPVYTNISGGVVGDTIYYMPTCVLEYQTCVIESVEMRCDRKVFFLKTGDVMIEGIGSTQGLFPYEIADDSWSRPWAPDPTGVSASLSDYGIKVDGDLCTSFEEQLLRCTEDGVVIYEGGHLYDTPAGLSSESVKENDFEFICDEKGILLLAECDLCGAVYRIHTLTGECVVTGYVDADSRIDYVLPNNELCVLTIESDKGLITKKVMR